MSGAEHGSTSGIPVIDLGPWLSGDPAARARTAAAVDTALSRAGFLLVTGHGVGPEVGEDCREWSRCEPACDCLCVREPPSASDQLRGGSVGHWGQLRR